MNQGKIIEYIDHGDFNIAVCLQDEISRLHLLTPTNREVNLPVKRALVVSKTSLNTQVPRSELLKRLRSTEEERNRIKSAIDVKELWELVKDEKESFDHTYLAQLCFGEEVTDDHVSALVRALFEDKIHFKMKEELFLPQSDEKVEQTLRQIEEEELREKKLAEGSGWLKKLLDEQQVEDPPCKEEIVQALTEMALYEDEAPSLKFGKELLHRAGGYGISEARQILVKLGIWDEDENLDLLRFGIPTAFSDEDMLESERLSRVEFGTENREDLRHLSVFTVDGPLTRDFDDALSIEEKDDTFHVGIHIADVAGLIPPDSKVDEEAFHRGSSIYLPRRQIPMLPPTLSQETLSLKEGCDRWAISLLCTLDREGNLLDFRFSPSLIRVGKRYVYDEVNEQHIREDHFQQLLHLSRIFRQKRIEAGALLLTLPEVVIEVDQHGAISVQKIDQETPSRMMVAEFMILHNRLAARFAGDHGIPVLFRSQEKPSERLSSDGLDYVYYVFKQRRKLNPLSIVTDPKPHSGLGVDAYTQASSPIRRYFDLLVQRQLRSFLLKGTPCYRCEDLEQKRMALESTLRHVDRMTRNRTRYWIYKYLLQQAGAQFSAFILDVMKSKCRILLPDLLLVAEMKIGNGQKFSEGQKIVVRIKKSDPWGDLLRVEYAGNG
jgi:exoribonuclease-2